MTDYTVPVCVSCSMLTTTDVYRPPASTSVEEPAPARVLDPLCRVEVAPRDSGETGVVVEHDAASEVTPLPSRPSGDQPVLLSGNWAPP